MNPQVVCDILAYHLGLFHGLFDIGIWAEN
ncbi:hypothetical protein D049_3213A, partial [Vibrio parahaemolyticus VPTS-2010]